MIHSRLIKGERESDNPLRSFRRFSLSLSILFSFLIKIGGQALDFTNLEFRFEAQKTTKRP